MKRSIVKQGAATLMVSLPSKWAKKYHLKKGDDINLVEKGKNIVVTAEAVEIKKTKLNLAELGKIWKRVITSFYNAGYDEIEITFEKHEDIAKIHSILNEFVGFEMVSQKEKSCIIKDVSDAKETSFTAMMTRTFNLLVSIADDCSNAIKNGKIEVLRTIPERGLIVNKYANSCKRLINKGLVENTASPVLYHMIESVEMLGDIYKSFAKHIYSAKNVPDKKTTSQLDGINDLIMLSGSMALGLEKQSIIAFNAKYEKIHHDLNELMNTKSATEIKTLCHLSEMLGILDNLFGDYLTISCAKM